MFTKGQWVRYIEPPLPGTLMLLPLMNRQPGDLAEVVAPPAFDSHLMQVRWASDRRIEMRHIYRFTPCTLGFSSLAVGQRVRLMRPVGWFSGTNPGHAIYITGALGTVKEAAWCRSEGERWFVTVQFDDGTTVTCYADRFEVASDFGFCDEAF